VEYVIPVYSYPQLVSCNDHHHSINTHNKEPLVYHNETSTMISKYDNTNHSNYSTSYSSFSDSEKEGLYKAIFSRRDVRSHFITGKNIPDALIFRILNAAHHAPSVGFSQPWNFIVIKDESIRKQVKDSFLIEHRKSISILEQYDNKQRKEKYLSLKLEGIPENIKLVAYLCLGYVEEFADKPDLEKAGWLPRLELDKVVYYDQWNGEVKDT
jgi:nitroreductase